MALSGRRRPLTCWPTRLFLVHATPPSPPARRRDCALGKNVIAACSVLGRSSVLIAPTSSRGSAPDSEVVPKSPLGAQVLGSARLHLVAIGGMALARTAPGYGLQCGVDAGISPPRWAPAPDHPTTACTSMPVTGTVREKDVTAARQLVKSRRGPRRSALLDQALMNPSLPWWFKGRCSHGLAPGYRTSSCREPLRCSCSLRNGHRYRGCKNKWRPMNSLPYLAFVPPSPFPRPSYVPAQPLVPTFIQGWGWPLPALATLPYVSTDKPAMPRFGDAVCRPDEDFVVVLATPEMQAESVLLSTNAAVAWFKDGRKDMPCHEVVAAFATTFGYQKVDVSVVRHLPEQFFVRFMY
ncbi:hypothetical protein ZWY2020_022836 [Hordeum vulgare]|nr:hypothetical protein ZWY2020_022836 [Hordeum vulgare]